MKRVVAVMAKQPSPGRTKTRLTPTLSNEEAADFYQCLLLDTLTALQARQDTDVVIAVAQPDSSAFFAELAPHLAQVPQGDGPLGDRLDTVLTTCLSNGYGEAFAIGGDSPDLPPTHLDDAFAALECPEVDLVFGPSDDGGYYLIGQTQRWPEVVTEVRMSTPSVLADTLTVARRVGASVHLAPAWYDVDLPADLDRLRLPGPGTAAQSVAWLDKHRPSTSS